MDCVICDSKIMPEANGWSGGANAEPVAEGRCCKSCDENVVIPTRISLFLDRKIKIKDMEGGKS